MVHPAGLRPVSKVEANLVIVLTFRMWTGPLLGTIAAFLNIVYYVESQCMLIILPYSALKEDF